MVNIAGRCSLHRALIPARPFRSSKSWILAYRSGANAGTRIARFSSDSGRVPEFAFAFDIDGVLLRSSEPILGARETLLALKKHQIPFILLTNGGGKRESQRTKDLSNQLNVPLHENLLIQSHTPYGALVQQKPKLADAPVLVLGGWGDKCRNVAESYGFKNVVIPSDIFHTHPEIWPFSAPFKDYHAQAAKPLPLPLFVPTAAEPEPIEGKHLRIHAIFVYNDPRDMGLDTQLVLDLLLSHKGFLGTTSKRNGRSDLPNHGFQDDSQPPLYFANPDLFWAAKYHLSRLGSGGFQASLRGLWDEVTGKQGIGLKAINGGKPHGLTYEFAERRILQQWEHSYGSVLKQSANQDAVKPGLKRIYMVGDNPASDITGANSFRSPDERKWLPVLVRTGVWKGEQPKKDVEKPYQIVDNVHGAMEFVLKKEGWA